VSHRYRPQTIAMLRTCLGGCPDDMEVEVKPGVPLVAKTVADLRAAQRMVAQLGLDRALRAPASGKRRRG
jgi:hypothetical protein